MFGKKYVPSVKANMKFREETIKELKAVLYKLEKGKYDQGLDAGVVKNAIAELTESVRSLQDAIGTGEENIQNLYSTAISQIKQLRTQVDQSMTHRLEESVDEIGYTIGLWKDVLNGDTHISDLDTIEVEKQSRRRKKLNERLAQLMNVKTEFVANQKRLEKDLAGVEADIAELEAAMLKEENERKINNLFRSIKSAKSKVDLLSVRQGNYSACFHLLDAIYVNAKEMLAATNYAGEELAKVKVLLDIDKLKKVAVAPDKAIAILKRMDAEIKTIASKTESIDTKVFGLDTGETTVSEDALKYKEALMKKLREKESLKEEIAISKEEINQDIMEGEQKNGTV